MASALVLPIPVERCQLNRCGGVDVYFYESSCRKKENEHEGQEQLFHGTSISWDEGRMVNTAWLNGM